MCGLKMKTKAEVLEFIAKRITWSEGRINGQKYRGAKAYMIGVEDVLNYRLEVSPFSPYYIDHERYKKGYQEAFRALWRKS